MQPLTFPCPQCGKRMGVNLDLAGKAVRCPSCRQVVTAPTPPTPARPVRDQLAPVAPPREGSDSIFGGSEEEEESVFAAPSGPRSPILPRPEPPQPAPSPPPPPPPAVDESNPFASLAEAPSEPPPSKRERKAAPRALARERPAAPRTAIPLWIWLALAALTLYSLLMTAVAAWGWLRR